MGVIDADAHVIETERTWSFMLEQDQRFAPELLVSTKNGVEFWRIDDRCFTSILVSMSPKSPVILPMSPRVSLTWTHWASTSRFSIRRFFYGR